MSDSTTNQPASIEELEQKISVSLLLKIDSADDKRMGDFISLYGEFQAARYRRAYIAQIGKLPSAAPSQP